jgi:hypothetical protein
MANRHDTTKLRTSRHTANGLARRRSQDLPAQQQSKVMIGATYWQPWGDLDVAEWIVLGRRLGTIGRGVAWWIGDWLNYGNTKFGQKYTRAARITGYDTQSLMNMSYVASRFDSSRRREDLSWSHHAELAGLAAEHQEMWLDRAERDHLSVRSLRETVRTWRTHELSDSQDTDPAVRRPSDGAGDRPADAEVVCPQCGYCMSAEDNRDNA